MTPASWTAASLSGWSSGTDPCSVTWTGVTCSGGLPATVDLRYRGLVGTLPSLLSYVPALTSVKLSGNALYGTLPASWSALTSLRTLDLGSNQVWRSLGRHQTRFSLPRS